MSIEPILPAITTDQFFACDMRAGTVVGCELNPKARKPAYKLSIDFGPLGMKTSSAQLTGLYSPAQLVGRQIIAVMNFAPRNVAGVESQCLVLGVDSPGGVVLLAMEREVENGSRVY